MAKNFIEYHGCNFHNYEDGTRKHVSFHCSKPTSFPFWKLPKDVTNIVAESTRAQLENKMIVTQQDIRQYRTQNIWKLPSTDTVTISRENSHTRNHLTGDNLIIDTNEITET